MVRDRFCKSGRSTTNGAFIRVPMEMAVSEAFNKLTASAHRVLLRFLWKNYRAGSNLPKGALNSKPVFTFTNSEARMDLGMNQTTFSRAKAELVEKGFIHYEKRGGLRGVNGCPSEFSLSSDWKTWKDRGGIKEFPSSHGKNLKRVT